MGSTILERCQAAFLTQASGLPVFVRDAAGAIDDASILLDVGEEIREENWHREENQPPRAEAQLCHPLVGTWC